MIIIFSKISYLLPVLIVSFLNISPISATNKVFAKDPQNLKDAKILASIPEEDIYLYALDWKEAERKQTGVYKDILLIAKRDSKRYPCWKIQINYESKLVLSDINDDGNKELVLITSSAGGTGVHEEDIHVYRIGDDGYLYDIYVMDPREAIYQNVKTKMTKKNGIVTISINVRGKTFTMTAKESSLGSWGNEVGFGAMYYYNVVDNKLTVIMDIVVGNNVAIADIVMDYVFKNKRLRVNNITFKKREYDWIKWAN